MNVNRIEPVVFVIDCLYGGASGGTEKQFLRMLQARFELGIEPTIVFLRDKPAHHETEFPVTPVVLDVDSLFSLKFFLAIRRLSRIVDSASAKTVQSYFDDASILCAFLTHFRGDLRFICSQRNLGDERSPAKHRLFRWVYARADCIAANSAGIRDRLSERCGIGYDKVKLVDNLIDINALSQKKEADNDPVERILELKRSCDFLVVSIANLRSIKGVEDIINAASLMPLDLKIKVAIIGDGPERDRFDTLIDSLGLQDRVCLLGYHQNAAAVLPYADAAILASHSEGGSNALIEYMLAGLPIIVTDVGGNSDFVKHKETALTVPVADPAAISKALSSLFSDSIRAKQMGKRALVYARQRFDRDRVLAAHRALYHET